MSLSWTDSTELAEALSYAASRNVITVTSAGNQSLSSPHVLAQYATQYGISVGAVNRDLTIADFSNRAGSDRRLQHVVAPGVSIYSTMPNGRYSELQGTSMAAPHVAGVVALMLSANPYLTSAQVRQILTGTATYLPGTAASTSSESFPVQMTQTVVWELNQQFEESDRADLFAISIIDASEEMSSNPDQSFRLLMAESTPAARSQDNEIIKFEIALMDAELLAV
jgi:Subtilase family